MSLETVKLKQASSPKGIMIQMNAGASVHPESSPMKLKGIKNPRREEMKVNARLERWEI